MKLKFCSLVLRGLLKYLLQFALVPVLFHSPISAQTRSNKDRIDYNELYRFVLDKYGFDQVLANGIIYIDKYWKKEGHQFFLEDRLYKGNLVFKGREYQGLEMKYDIVNQQLIVFIRHNFLQQGIVPPHDFISAFNLEETYFSKYEIDGEPRFYQVVFDSDKLKCLYNWSKQALETASSGNYEYYHFEFTGSKRKSYLNIEGSFELYRNNKTFTALFPNDMQSSLRHYMKVNHINVSKCTDEKMIELLKYCTSLL
jgi:hypothetical protein